MQPKFLFRIVLSLLIVPPLLSSCSLRSFATDPDPSFTQISCIPVNETHSTIRLITIISLGWHTGILFTSSDLPESLKKLLPEFKDYSYVELGWGDRDFYMASGYSMWAGIRAALASDGAVLHVAGFRDNEIDRYLREASITEITVTRQGFDQLVNFIARHIQLNPDGSSIPLGRSLYGNGRFYAATGDFSLVYTCNSWTGDAIKAAGCSLQGNYRRASTLIRALRKLKGGYPPAVRILAILNTNAVLSVGSTKCAVP